MSQEIGSGTGAAPGAATSGEPGTVSQQPAAQLPADDTAKRVKDLEEQFNTFRSIKDREVSEAQRRASVAEQALEQARAESVMAAQQQYDASIAALDPEERVKAELDNSKRQWGAWASEAQRRQFEIEKRDAVIQHGIERDKALAARSPAELNALVAEAAQAKTLQAQEAKLRKQIEVEYAAKAAPSGSPPAKIVEMRGADTGATDLQAMQQAISDFEDGKISKGDLAKIRARFEAKVR